jgi:hypothetical protein
MMMRPCFPRLFAHKGDSVIRDEADLGWWAMSFQERLEVPTVGHTSSDDESPATAEQGGEPAKREARTLFSCLASK